MTLPHQKKRKANQTLSPNSAPPIPRLITNFLQYYHKLPQNWLTDLLWLLLPGLLIGGILWGMRKLGRLSSHELSDWVLAYPSFQSETTISGLYLLASSIGLVITFMVIIIVKLYK